MKKTKKKKVFLFIHQCILKGGVEKVFFNLINNLSTEKYDFEILSVMGYMDNDFNEQLFPHNVSRKCLMWDQLSTNPIHRTYQKIHNRLFPNLYKLLLRFKKFDIAIAAQEGMYADYVVKNIKATKKFLWIHNDMSQCHWTKNFFGSIEAERNCYSSFDKVICVSEGVKKGMNAVLGNLNNLCVCYNPIDTNEIDRKLKAPMPKRNKLPLFVCIGRLAHQKGYDRLLKICKRLNDEGEKYNIWILGEGEDRPKIEKYISENNLANITLFGNVNNPFIFMKIADWILTPSRHEGFGMVLQEGTYCGTPTIVTDVAGAKEMFGDSEFGIVVENSEESIYEVLKNVLHNPDIHSHYKAQAMQRSSFVDLNKRISQIERVIND